VFWSQGIACRPNAHERNEVLHIHCVKGDCEARFNIRDLVWMECSGFTRNDIRKWKNVSGPASKSVGQCGRSCLAKRTGKMEYGKVDQIKGELTSKSELVQISVKMEGDLLDALKAHAAKQKRPYQTVMKEMLRAQLANENVKTLVDREDLRAMVNRMVDARLKAKKVD